MNIIIRFIIIVVIFISSNKAQSIICDSCKGDVIYSEEAILDSSQNISVSIFRNICPQLKDYDYEKCGEINIHTFKSFDTLQTLQFVIFFSGSTPSRSIINIQDINFDGFSDLIILQNDLGEYRSFFNVYVYDSQKNLFELREYYCTIFNGNWNIDYEKKTVITSYEAGFHSYEYHKYIFINGDYEEIDDEIDEEN